MNKWTQAIFIACLLVIGSACTPATPSESSVPELRITNAGAEDFHDLIVLFPGETPAGTARIEFGKVAVGETTAYHLVPHGVYRYAAYEYTLDGETAHQPVMDWVGEQPLAGTRFTYQIALDTTRVQGDQMQLIGVRPESDEADSGLTTDTTSPIPAATAPSASCAKPDAVTFTNDVLGLTLSAPARYELLVDQYLDDEFGVTLRNSVGEIVVQIVWLHEVTAGDEAALVGEMVASLSDIPIQRTTVEVDGRTATMLAPVPGEVANTLIFVPVGDRLYTVRFFTDELDERDRCLLDSLRFGTPTQSLASLNLTPIAETIHPTPATETAVFATETAAQTTPDAPLPPSPPPLTLADVSAEWTRHDLAEWGVSLSMPADWEKGRMPGFFGFTPPTGGNAQLTVGLESHAPVELAALTEMLQADWLNRTPLDFYMTPITVAGVEGVAVWNTSPYVCADVYLPGDGIVHHISFGAPFCNEARDQLNEVGQKVLDTIELYAPE